MIKEATEKLSKRENITKDETRAVFDEIMGGKASHDEMKAFLISLAEKGETTEEIIAAAGVMRKKMKKLALPYETVLDTCGTGGGARSFNVSTIVAIVAAGCGAKVAKHGNRSYTSHCGSADILERLGVKIDIEPSKVALSIEEAGVGFLFAPLYHSSMKHVSGVRREIKRRTIFNILGPLSNPAGANRQLIGVFDVALTEVFAGVLKDLGSKRAFIVHGLDGFDEVSISDGTRISELVAGEIKTYVLMPEDFGIERAKKEDVACKTIEENLAVVKSVLSGERSVHKRMVLVNAALALMASGNAATLKEGVKVASDCIDSGNAREVLNTLIKVTNG
ncbi:MAG: anthranilate phosphoribosyltransferase [Candidatus Omnitrophota bacterium]